VDAGVPVGLVLTIARYFDDMLLRINEGQHLDLSFESQLDINEADYLSMVERKTAALLAGSLYMGALAGGGSPTTASALEEYGTFLGLAYQIQDDMLGIWGDPERTGKPVADDLYSRKKSSPVVYALAHTEAAERELLRSLYSQADIAAPEVDLLLAILDRSGARRYAEETVAYYSNMAVASLDRVPEGDPVALEELRILAQQLLGRAS